MRGDHGSRQGPDDEGNSKQENKAFIFYSKCDGKPLEGCKQGNYSISFEF